MKKQAKTLILSVAALYAGILPAYAAGDSGAAFLRIPVGARASALGEAYGGISGDLDALYWNPAGLAGCRDLAFNFSYLSWLEEIKYQNLTAGKPLAGGYAALGVNMLGSGDMDMYDSAGYATGDETSAQDLLLTLSYARVVNGFSVASSLKYISSTLDDESAAAFGIDLGVQREFYPVNVGLSLHNIGTQVKFREEGDPLPLIIRLGAAVPFHIGDLSLRGLTDLSFSRDVSFKANAGIEASHYIGDVGLYLRGGFKLYAEELDGLSNLTAGGGLSWGGFRLDYALSPYGDLGSAHRVSTSYLFGAPSPGRADRVSGRRQDPDKLYQEGLRRLEQGEYLDAIELFTNVLIINPEHKGALKSLDEANRKLK